MITIEDIHKLVGELLQKWCDPKLLKSHYWSSKESPPISYGVCINNNNHTIIYLDIKSGPFGEMKHYFERKYFSREYLDESKITNQIFNALTFDGSPFYFKKNKFYKQLEMY